MKNKPHIAMKKKEIVNLDFARAVGKSSLLRIDWKSWKTEMPKSGQDIWVVLRMSNGYSVLTGTYFDEVIPARGPFKESRWKQIKFHDGMSEMLVGKEYADKNQKRLVAWGAHRGVIRLTRPEVIDDIAYKYAPKNRQKDTRRQ